jgi:glycosyltransferase involved in cell wall biosynthesis
MKILHVISGLSNGGAEAILSRLILNDPSNEHSVISLSTVGYYGKILSQMNVEVHALSMPRGRLTLRGTLSLLLKIRSGSPDIIQTWMYHSDFLAGLLAYGLGKKEVVWGIHNSNLDKDKVSTSTRLVAKICSLLSSFLPARIISCSSFAISEHVRLGYSQKRFDYIPNGYDLDKFYPSTQLRDKFRRDQLISDSVFVLGMIARWDVIKDHRTLFASLEIFKNTTKGKWTCVLAGAGINSENLALIALIKKFNLEKNVLLLGIQDDMTLLMNGLDVVVLSSLGEAFPNVIAEAMACSIPVISTDVGDASHILGGAGWVVPISNSAELARAITEARSEMGDEERWPKRKIACRKRIANEFAQDLMLLRYNRIWKSVKGLL